MLWGFWIHLCTVISLLQKQLAGSNLKGWLCINEYLRRRYLNKIETHILRNLTLKNLQHYNHSSLSYNHCQVIYSLLWYAKSGLSFLIKFQPLCKEIAKYYCFASSVHNLSFHNIFHLQHDEVHDETKT